MFDTQEFGTKLGKATSARLAKLAIKQNYSYNKKIFKLEISLYFGHTWLSARRCSCTAVSLGRHICPAMSVYDASFMCV
jgi:hypothetical protein